MKKFLSAIFAAALGAASLCAGDAEDVKAVIFKNLELQERHDFKALPALYSRDYLQIDARGGSYDYVMLTLLCVAMDGRHPEEFLQYVEMLKNGGRLPSPETMAQIGQMVLDPAVVRVYKAALVRILAYVDKESAARRKSVEFVRFEVRGDLATVVEEYDGCDPESGAPKHKTFTTVLRREDGVWRLFRVIEER